VTLVLGVDGGSTKTHALVADARGSVLGFAATGSAEFHFADADAGIASILDAATNALARASITTEDLDAACFSVAGADWPEDFTFLEERLAASGFHTNIVIVNDAIGGLRSGSTTGRGVAVASGTDLAVGARGPLGDVWWLGYWVEADHSLRPAEEALRAVYRAHLGLSLPTALTEAVLREFGQPDPEALLHHLTGRSTSHPPAEIARAAVPLLDVAATGDPEANRIVEAYAATVARIVDHAARAVRLEAGFPLVLTGGLMRHESGQIPRRIGDQLLGLGLSPEVLRPLVPPVTGAVLLALEYAGLEMAPRLIDALQQSALLMMDSTERP
jgi:N-acetylglucosamine kinase-like BadF-type ATPase